MATVARSTWYQGTAEADAAEQFQGIQTWWSNLNGKEVMWQQRALSGLGDLSSIDWSPQRFDERFFISNPEVRGITLYWHKANEPDQEHNTTPQRLELDWDHQQLYVFPQSQQGLVLRVTLPQLVYQTITLKDPELSVASLDEYQVLTFKDDTKQVKVQVVLSAETVLGLKAQL